MKQLPPFPLGAALVLATLVASGPLTAHEADQGKPSLTLKASPAVAFSPARIVLVAELRGGPNDYEQYYCPGIEWEWGDGTTSENVEDCEPFEPGKIEVEAVSIAAGGDAESIPAAAEPEVEQEK